MGKTKATEIVKGATIVAYPDNYRYCNKVIETLMSVVSADKILEKKEVEIVSVMCGMCIDGKNYMRVPDVMEEMEKCGVDPVVEQTLRNYWSSIRRKGWLVGRQLNLKMMKAIKDERFSLCIFFDRDGRS